MSPKAVAAIIAVIFAASPAEAAGQEAFRDVQQTLRHGDRIRVDDRSGAVVEGRVEGMSGSSIRVLRKDHVIELPEEQIGRIRRMRREPDGVLIGLGIGAAVGLSYVGLQCSGSSESGDCRRAGSAILVGPSAVAGALIDRAIRRFDTIFDRNVPSRPHVSVVPITTGHRRGVAVTLAY
jgi:hypothetical protein